MEACICADSLPGNRRCIWWWSIASVRENFADKTEQCQRHYGDNWRLTIIRQEVRHAPAQREDDVAPALGQAVGVRVLGEGGGRALVGEDTVPLGDREAADARRGVGGLRRNGKEGLRAAAHQIGGGVLVGELVGVLDENLELLATWQS